MHTSDRKGWLGEQGLLDRLRWEGEQVLMEELRWVGLSTDAGG